MSYKILLSPHQDDAALFAAFTLLKHKPLVLTVFDSYRQFKRGGPDWATRQAEDYAAVEGILECAVLPLGFHDDVVNDDSSIREAILSEMWDRNTDGEPLELWAPAPEPSKGNVDHEQVARIAKTLGAAQVHYYLTYSEHGKSVRGTEVVPEPAWVLKKLKALACYESQIVDGRLGCWPHFIRDQREYIL